ncbi:conjugative transfer region protein TrbK [compost metagenome]
MGGSRLIRVAAVALVAVAFLGAAIAMSRKGDGPLEAAVGGRGPASADPLRSELRRCVGMGEAGARDASCLHVWAENRQRFLRPGHAERPAFPDTSLSSPAQAVQPGAPVKVTAPLAGPNADEVR